LTSDSTFFSLVEAGSGLTDRLDKKYFVPLCSGKRKKGGRKSIASAAKKNGASALLYCHPCHEFQVKTGWENSLGRVRLRSRAQLPIWAGELRKMLAFITRTKVAHCEASIRWRTCEPAMIYARRRLRQRLNARLRHQFSKAAMARLENQLRRRLSRTAKRAIDLELSIFKEAHNYVEGIPERTTFEEFAKDPAINLLVLLESFPALAHLWSQLIIDWLSQVGQLAKRLERDRPAISKRFFSGRNPGRLVDLRVDLSDPHCGGREVIVFVFERGPVVYKPRDADAEYQWFELLHWMNRQGFAAKLKIPRMVRRKTYSWMEFIPSEPCRSKAAARRFYRRAGAITLAAYLVRAIDCHCGNLIASGEHPVLIDFETLMHGQVVFGIKNLDLGIFGTGLLPLPKSANLPQYDHSAFSQREPGPHTPILNGKILRASTYRREIITGFREAWSLTLNNQTRRKSLGRRLRRLKTGRWRHLYWPTSNYVAALEASISPSALRLGTERIHVLGKHCARQSVSTTITRQEIISLERFDVPRFLKMAGAQAQLPSTLQLPKAIEQLRAALSRDG
jgi:lantibiotic modifying enzyme